MILRLAHQLAKKIKVSPSRVLPLDANPYADWTARLFTADRAHYLLITNTASLYSALMHGRGITSDSQLLDRGLSCLRETLVDDGQEFLYRRHVAPFTDRVSFSKALSRSMTGSMNDFVAIAKLLLVEDDLAPHDVAARLNDMPMSALSYANPRAAFKSLVPPQEPSSDKPSD